MWSGDRSESAVSELVYQLVYQCMHVLWTCGCIVTVGECAVVSLEVLFMNVHA